ncbi:flagella assembly protein FlgT middle domain-containing protein [Undibacterium sp. Ji83W]|uniref:flagella assembly protein FlgT middle domain-containing protein n=1 Tax=Undibacterium sp. Ji83W TaxID=3413043 RepID=UPI003BF3C064
MVNRIALILLGVFFSAHSIAQMTDPGLPPNLPPNKALVLTGFAVNKPVQVLDIDDASQGFPKAIARRLMRERQVQVRISPDLLSFDWQQDHPPVNLLQQLGQTYASRYIVSGEIRNAGTKIDTNLFGLTQKRTRAIELEVRIYDASTGQLLAQQEFSNAVAGNVSVGREHVFDGAAFNSTLYGKTISDMLDQVASLVSATVMAQH